MDSKKNESTPLNTPRRKKRKEIGDNKIQSGAAKKKTTQKITGQIPCEEDNVLEDIPLLDGGIQQVEDGEIIEGALCTVLEGNATGPLPFKDLLKTPQEITVTSSLPVACRSTASLVAAFREEEVHVANSGDSSKEVGYDPMTAIVNKRDSNMWLASKTSKFIRPGSPTAPVYWRHVMEGDWDLIEKKLPSGNIKHHLILRDTLTGMEKVIYEMYMPFGHCFESSVGSNGTIGSERYESAMRQWASESEIAKKSNHILRLTMSMRPVERVGDELPCRRNMEMLCFVKFMDQVVLRYVALRVTKLKNGTISDREKDVVDRAIERNLRMMKGVDTENVMTMLMQNLYEDGTIKPITFRMNADASERVGLSVSKRLYYNVEKKDGTRGTKPKYILQDPIANREWDEEGLQKERVIVQALYRTKPDEVVTIPDNGIAAPTVSLTFSVHDGMLKPKLKLGHTISYTGNVLDVGLKDHTIWLLPTDDIQFPGPSELEEVAGYLK